MLAYEFFFLELKPLGGKNTQKTLNLSFQQLSLHANINFCWVPPHPDNPSALTLP